MLSSIPMREPTTGKVVQIHVDCDTLARIVKMVSQDDDAMHALRLGKQIIDQAKKNGRMSSTRPPEEYKILYHIMNEFDGRYAGALGPKIIRHLEKVLLGSEEY